MTVTPRELSVKVGEPIRLQCTADGQPAPTLVWRDRNGKEHQPVNGEFVIDAADMSHTGQYTCTATNTVGTTSDTANVVVEPSVAAEIEVCCSVL